MNAAQRVADRHLSGAAAKKPSLEAIVEMVSNRVPGLGAVESVAVGSSTAPAYFFPVASKKFEFRGKGVNDTPRAHHAFLQEGMAIFVNSGGWPSGHPQFIRALQTSSGTVFEMPPLTKEQSSSVGSGREHTWTTKLLDQVDMIGLDPQDYQALYDKITKVLVKALKAYKEFLKEGAGVTDVTPFKRDVEVFLRKWAKGANWGGKAKNVVLVESHYKGRNGPIEIGLIINSAMVRDSLNEVPPKYLQYNLFKLVVRSEDTGEVQLGGGFDALQRNTSIPGIARALEEARKFNWEVVKPWREALTGEKEDKPWQIAIRASLPIIPGTGKGRR